MNQKLRRVIKKIKSFSGTHLYKNMVLYNFEITKQTLNIVRMILSISLT